MCLQQCNYQGDLQNAIEATMDCFLTVRQKVKIEISKVTIYTGVMDTLEYLKNKGYILVSNTNGNAIVELIPDLKHIFNFNIRGEEINSAKPDTKVFIHVIINKVMK